MASISWCATIVEFAKAVALLLGSPDLWRRLANKRHGGCGNTLPVGQGSGTARIRALEPCRLICGANFVSQNPRLLLACAYQWTGVAQLDDTAVSTRVLIHDLIHRLSEPSAVLFDDFG
jgi:hypothetical protein